MDRVAFDFRERVAALWKCCDSGYHYDGCVHKRVPDCEWTMKSKKELIDFAIGEDNGVWSYRFTNPDRTEGAKKYLSMVEMKKNPNLKNVRIEQIKVTNNAQSSINFLRSLEDMERLMKFVVFLSNEPYLELDISNVKVFDSPEGAILLNSLSKMTFSSIWASYGFPVYNQIVENQFSRRKPTAICCFESILHNSEFIAEHMGNGNIKKFYGPYNFRFPAEVMERIINRFLENPEIYDQLNIETQFEESTKEMLERKLAEGSCKKFADFTDDSTEYRFTANNPELKNNPCLRITISTLGCIDLRC